MGIVVFSFPTSTGDAAVSRSSFDRAGLALMFSTIVVLSLIHI